MIPQTPSISRWLLALALLIVTALGVAAQTRTSQPDSPVRLFIHDARTGDPIRGLVDGGVIDFATMGDQLTIRAGVLIEDFNGSVTFTLDDAEPTIENLPPFTLLGDNPDGSFVPWTPPLGDHTLTVTVTEAPDGAGNVLAIETVSFTVYQTAPTLTPLPDATYPVVLSLVLVDSRSQIELEAIEDGEVFVLPERDLFEHQLNVRAIVSPPEAAGSVRFDLNGEIGTRVENTPPYTLFGDTNGVYESGTLFPGTYTLTATTFSGANATGAAWQPYTVTFEIVGSD